MSLFLILLPIWHCLIPVSPRSFCTEVNFTVSVFYALVEGNGSFTLSLDPPLQTCPLYVPKFSAAFLLCWYPSQICSLFQDRSISVYSKRRIKLLKSYWKSWRSMLEKHCFISPFVYKEMAQIRGTYGSSVWALFHLPNIYFSHTEKVSESWERKMNVSLCWKIEFWFEKKRRKWKCQDFFLNWSETEAFWIGSRQNMLPEEPFITVLLWAVEDLRCIFLPFLKEQTLETHIPSTTNCGFCLAPSKCFSFPLDFEQESWTANGNVIETDVFLFSLNCNFLAKITVWKILAKLTDRPHKALKTEGMLKTII